MNTFTQILYQIVFATKNHEKNLIDQNRKALFQYIFGILNEKKCHLYRIGGVRDHIHIVTHVHPTVALSDLVRDIKVASSGFIKDQHLFPNFSGWQDGYGGFTYSIEAKDNLIEYVKNQEEHHRKRTFKEELIALLKEHGIPYDEKYLL
ncbi:MAG TPA: IS200/IS605 family transposase [Bacteroidales bacterium]|nr:IS200/IS605 family transposase [Bacteroidales bacterium]